MRVLESRSVDLVMRSASEMSFLCVFSVTLCLCVSVVKRTPDQELSLEHSRGD
jgi:hypothetical protein